MASNRSEKGEVHRPGLTGWNWLAHRMTCGTCICREAREQLAQADQDLRVTRNPGIAFLFQV
jgi:hypothetical protein